ncbi:MAG: antitoxin family protein [Anaerolineae bacterium]|nr:antitoxin family protein [Anaerolineae bacterium]MDQ7034362.1 antitoxin family protein [Anaerolineae bacterium]
MVSIRAIYENGKLRLLDPVELQEGQEVKIIIVPKGDNLQERFTGRIPDLHPGGFYMSEDFDDPLPDSFWLGEDE